MSNQRERCYALPTPAFPIPSNAPAMQKGGPITLTDWLRLQPDATQAQTLGMAALVMSDWLPRFCIRSLYFWPLRTLRESLEAAKSISVARARFPRLYC